MSWNTPRNSIIITIIPVILRFLCSFICSPVSMLFMIIVEIINGKTKNQLTNLDMVNDLLKSTTQKAFRGELTKHSEAA